MKSTISAAVFGAALCQAASIHHGHAHVHSKRAPAASLEERAPIVNYMEASDVTKLTSMGIQAGKNFAAGTKGAPVAVGNDGPFKMHLSNLGKDDIVVVAWSSQGQANPWDACFVSAQQAAVTHTLKAGTNTTLSFDPSQNNGAISGALAPLYPGQKLSSIGQVDNTWVEYTFTNQNQFSTTDVSRLINMNGNKIETHNYADDDAHAAGTVACSSTMDACSFVCADGAPSPCIKGKIQNCPVGGAGNTASANAMDGGCAGMSAKAGVVQVNFF